MPLSLEDQDFLEHHKKMLKIRQRNLYTYEEQEASFGRLNVQPHVVSEIELLTQHIKDHKAEINRLVVRHS
jgi:hypothetical protein